MNDISQINPDETSDWLQSTSLPATDRTERATFNKSTSLTLSTSTALPSEILSNLDERICFTALEYVMTLLASQSLLALKDVNLSNRNKQLIKRELSTELHIFHDWVKKTLRTDLNRTAPAHRIDPVADKVSNMPRAPDSFFNRKHLDLNVGRGFLAESTPIGPKPKTIVARTATTPMESGQDADNTYTVETHVFTGLSMVKIVEEDYVHAISNIFTLICQSE